MSEERCLPLRYVITDWLTEAGKGLMGRCILH